MSATRLKTGPAWVLATSLLVGGAAVFGGSAPAQADTVPVVSANQPSAAECSAAGANADPRQVEQAAGRYTIPPSMNWLLADEPQKALAALAPVITDRKRVVGSFVDYKNQQYVVVASTGTDTALLEEEILGIVSTALPVRVRLVCGSLAADAVTKEAIEEILAKITPGISLDTAPRISDGKTAVILQVAPGQDSEASQILKDELVQRDDVVVEQYRPFGRWDDGEPHFGGAGVRADGFSGTGPNGNACSTGLPMSRDGINWFSSAAHCTAQNGVGPFWSSGVSPSRYYGVERAVNFTTDTMLLGVQQRVL